MPGGRRHIERYENGEEDHEAKDLHSALGRHLGGWRSDAGGVTGMSCAFGGALCSIGGGVSARIITCP